MLINVSLHLAYASDFVCGEMGGLLKCSSGHFKHGNGLSSGAAARVGAIIGYESHDDQTN